jgi:hypothetical protein
MQKAEEKGNYPSLLKLKDHSDPALQCDEAKPRCTRCDVRGYTCQYPGEDSPGNGLLSAKRSQTSPGSVDSLDPRLARLTIPTDTWSEMGSQLSTSNVSVSPSPEPRRTKDMTAGMGAACHF